MGALSEIELPGREELRGVYRTFTEKDLLIEAGALGFRALITLIPALLFTVGLLGFLGLDEVWRSDIAPDLRPNMSTTAFQFLDETVLKVLTQKQVFWVTLGAAFAVWEASAVVRAAGNVLNRIYEVRESRPFREELLTSIPLGALGIVITILAAVVVRLGPLALDNVLGTGLAATLIGFVIRWAIALGLMGVLLAALLRFAPDIERPPRGLSIGSLSILGAWAVATVAFGFYLQQIASYGSVFGNLATLFILVEYLFGVAVIFLGGAVVDHVISGREEAADTG